MLFSTLAKYLFNYTGYSRICYCYLNCLLATFVSKSWTALLLISVDLIYINNYLLHNDNYCLKIPGTLCLYLINYTMRFINYTLLFKLHLLQLRIRKACIASLYTFYIHFNIVLLEYLSFLFYFQPFTHILFRFLYMIYFPC